MREAEDTSQDVQEVARGIPGQTLRVAARLCNFKTGGSNLWPEHQRWLRDKVVPVLRDPQGAWVDVLAYASARGAANLNKSLSDRRREAVVEFLRKESGNPNFPVNRNHAFGEEVSGPDQKNNSGYFRAVDVYVYGGQKPPVVPPVQIGSVNFKIRVTANPSFSVTNNHREEVYAFELVDLDMKQTVNLLYVSGKFFPRWIPVPDIAEAASFTGFTLNKPASLGSFVGPATLFTEPDVSGTGSDIHLRFESLTNRGVFVHSKKPGARLGCVRMETRNRISGPGETRGIIGVI
jgi:hypothetical protein